MRYLLSLLFITSLLNSSMLLDNRGICIEDYYQKDSYLYILRSSTNTWDRIYGTGHHSHIIPNYNYNAIDKTCEPDISRKMGLSIEQFNFLLALTGLIFGGTFMFFTIQAFMNVGGKR